MHKRVLMFAILAASWVGVVPAYAADAGGTNAAAAAGAKAGATAGAKAGAAAGTEAGAAAGAKSAQDIANAFPTDKTNFLGDRIVFKEDTIGYLQQFDANGKPLDTETPICIPAETYLRGIGQTTKGAPLFVTDCTFRDQFFAWPPCTKRNIPQCDLISGKKNTGDHDTKTEPNPIKPGSPIRLDPKQLAQNATPPNRYGFTYGGLVVPFKFELTGKKEFKGSASAAPYMGYRLGFESSGIELAPVVFAGVSNVSATKTTTTAATATTAASSSTSTSDLAAFSYGAGVIGILKQTFQFGVVVGFDHAGSGQGFQYNDKPWLAVELGIEVK
jgi:hypothetical protein